jgi:tRNA-2-methylthio-N6-dimethylallyladenosine synthase
LQEKRQREEMLRFVGTREEVLVEGLSRRNANEVSGRCRHGITVSLAGSEEDIGRIVPVEITGVKLNTLAGSRIGDVI